MTARGEVILRALRAVGQGFARAARILRELPNPTCSRCRTRPRRAGQSWCAECHRIYMRERRAA